MTADRVATARVGVQQHIDLIVQREVIAQRLPSLELQPLGANPLACEELAYLLKDFPEKPGPARVSGSVQWLRDRF